MKKEQESAMQRCVKPVDPEEARRKRVKKSGSKVGEAEVISRKEDPAAAAAYRAEAEEAHMKHDLAGEAAAVKRWVATGDPEAMEYMMQLRAKESASLETDLDEDLGFSCVSSAAAARIEDPVSPVEMDFNMDEEDLDEEKEEDWSDPLAVAAKRFRDHWNYVWARSFGRFEDTTPIPSMRFTEKPAPGNSAHPMKTLQIFAIKMAGTNGSLQWPLDVFGLVAARDILDHNRNIIFSRERDNCQTITEEDPYLELTGPTRAVVVLDPVHLEVVLKVKGAIESEDKDLSFLVASFHQLFTHQSQVMSGVYTSKLSTLELTVGQIVNSVEATISVRVIGGSWPDGFRGVFTASTASIDHNEVDLLAFGDGKLPVTADDMIKLSRRVACVELNGELRVSAVAQRGNEEPAVERDDKVFTPKESGISRGILKIVSCEMEVIVAWSLLSDQQFFRRRTLQD